VSTESLRRETHIVGDTTSTRYRSEDADYALVVLPGTAAPRWVVEGFCTQQAACAVDVWCIDTPSNSRPALRDSAQETIMLGIHAARTTGLPVFLLGFGTGAAAAYQALQTSDAFWGAVLADDLPGDITPAGRSHPNQDASANSWLYHVLSSTTRLASNVVEAAQNAAPMLCVIAEHDPTLARMKANAINGATAHQAETWLHPADMYDLMTSEAGSDIGRDWCLRQLSNHLNPRWTGI
jgi:hypothetical protein